MQLLKRVETTADCVTVTKYLLPGARKPVSSSFFTRARSVLSSCSAATCPHDVNASCTYFTA